jgi:hypothetical protein
MDKAEQQQRILAIVNRLAMQAIGLPAAERRAFIDREIAVIKRDYERQYAADPKIKAGALEFADKLREWTDALLLMMERSGGVTGRA